MDENRLDVIIESMKDIRETVFDTHREFFQQYVDDVVEMKSAGFDPNQLPNEIFRTTKVSLYYDGVEDLYSLSDGDGEGGNKPMQVALLEELNLVKYIEDILKDIDESIDKRKKGKIANVEFEPASGVITGFDIYGTMISGNVEFVENLKEELTEKYASDVKGIEASTKNDLSPLEKARRIYDKGPDIWKGLTQQKIGEITMNTIDISSRDYKHEFRFDLILEDDEASIESVNSKSRHGDMNPIPHPDIDSVKCAVEYVSGGKLDEIHTFTEGMVEGDEHSRELCTVTYKQAGGDAYLLRLVAENVYHYDYDFISEKAKEIFGLDILNLPPEFDSIYILKHGKYETEEEIQENVLTEYSACIYIGMQKSPESGNYLKEGRLMTNYYGENYNYIAHGAYRKGYLHIIINFTEEVSQQKVEKTIEKINDHVPTGIFYNYADFSPDTVEVNKIDP